MTFIEKEDVQQNKVPCEMTLCNKMNEIVAIYLN